MPSKDLNPNYTSKLSETEKNHTYTYRHMKIRSENWLTQVTP